MQFQSSKSSVLNDYLKHNPVRYLAMFSLGLLFYGCGENRVIQCNKLVTIANKVSTLPVPKDAAGFNQFADSLSQVHTEVLAIPVQDATLKDLQAQLAAVYDTTAVSLKTQLKAKATKDIEAINQAQQDLEAAANKENEIADQINSLCKG